MNISFADEKDLQIIEMMQRFGGSFVQALARAWIAADSDNKMRIKTTWPEYWAQYEQFIK